MQQKTTTIYVTKWALTVGIERHEAVVHDNGHAGIYSDAGHFLFSVGKRDYHLTLACAHERVREMIAAARKSMAKKEAKLKQQEKALADGTFKVVAKDGKP